MAPPQYPVLTISVAGLKGQKGSILFNIGCIIPHLNPASPERQQSPLAHLQISAFLQEKHVVLKGS